MTIKEAKELDMVSYLSIAGMEPAKVKGNDYWYYSPFRTEKTPSFKVERKLNRWFDFGEGRGGSIIDFILSVERIPIPEILKKLASLDITRVSQAPTQEKSAPIEILSAISITTPALINYYRSRRISTEIANQYLSEVTYLNKGRSYYALGFKNDIGGYELRNPYYKGSSQPKAPTLFKNQSDYLAVFEGAFDFLSFLTITESQEQISRDHLVLNSTSFFEQQLPLMQSYNKVYLFLDNDPTGEKWTAKAVALNPQKFVDERPLYQGYKDVNDWHQHLGLQPAANRPLR